MNTKQKEDVVRRAEAIGARDITAYSWAHGTAKGGERLQWKVGFCVGPQNYGFYCSYPFWDRVLREREEQGTRCRHGKDD